MLTKFVKKEVFLLLIIFITFINPFFYGNRVAILFLIFVLLKIKNTFQLIDSNFFLILFFSVSYEFFSSFNVNYVDNGLFSIIPNTFVPSLLYITGKYIARNYTSEKVLVFLLLYLSFCFSFIPMISVIEQIINNGFIEGERTMYLLWDKNTLMSPTNLSAFFVLNIVSFGLINIKYISSIKTKIYISVIFVLSLLCVLRLGSRTQLIIAVLSFGLIFYRNFKNFSSSKKILTLLFLGGIIFYFSTAVDYNVSILKFYQDRYDSEQYGVGTAGGRTDRWLGSMESIFSDPLGWELDRYGYSHNMWLDIARMGGVISFILFLVFTINILFKFILMLKNNNNLFLKNLFIVYYLGFSLVFFVEPIMDGYYLLFLLFCLFTGILVEYTRTINTEQNEFNSV